MLQDYAERRDFKRTPEPLDDRRSAGAGHLTFVVQKHAARQLHSAVSTLAGQEIFDVERVTELKFAIDSGMYRLDPERVADKFHRFNQEL